MVINAYCVRAAMKGGRQCKARCLKLTGKGRESSRLQRDWRPGLLAGRSAVDGARAIGDWPACACAVGEFAEFEPKKRARGLESCGLRDGKLHPDKVNGRSIKLLLASQRYLEEVLRYNGHHTYPRARSSKFESGFSYLWCRLFTSVLENAIHLRTITTVLNQLSNCQEICTVSVDVTDLVMQISVHVDSILSWC
ncbi:hypothetical protein chiPu_0015053 [Chiloscyllium punctatum]|uniref:Uncharacterized protein n=1 Tax=Chiloscyllium punctatum TaxID=137246 RepID=A0A401T1R5_CHIPU|nr:hypothetical protein [Chiloscyllium punctatum]